MSTRWSALVAAGLVTTASALAGCSSGESTPASTSVSDPASPTSSSTSQSSTPSSTSSAPPTSPASTGETGVSAGMQYTVTRNVVEGNSPDGLGTWTTDYGVLTGGDPAVVEAFNAASQAAARDQVDVAIDGTSDGAAPWTFESNGTVGFRSIAVSQVIYGALNYGAHPSHQIGTIVIDSRSTDPVMLVDLFTDPQAALNVLAEQTREKLGAGGLEVAPDLPGAQPKAENFANWIPTADGLEFHFNSYQFGPRLPAVVTVPWSAGADLMTPAMADLAKS